MELPWRCRSEATSWKLYCDCKRYFLEAVWRGDVLPHNDASSLYKPRGKWRDAISRWVRTIHTLMVSKRFQPQLVAEEEIVMTYLSFICWVCEELVLICWRPLIGYQRMQRWVVENLMCFLRTEGRREYEGGNNVGSKIGWLKNIKVMWLNHMLEK